ncbi:unnamed protein product [Lota lota]
MELFVHSCGARPPRSTTPQRTGSYSASEGRTNQKKITTTMKDREDVVLPRGLRMLLLGMAALLLLGSAGLVCLLLRHRDLTQHVTRLEARLHVVSQGCGSLRAVGEAVEGGPLQDPEPLHRSRRRRGAEAPGWEDQDVLMMMTYSRVPVYQVKRENEDLKEIQVQQVRPPLMM